jgi:hypothetical protein
MPETVRQSRPTGVEQPQPVAEAHGVTLDDLAAEHGLPLHDLRKVLEHSLDPRPRVELERSRLPSPGRKSGSGVSGPAAALRLKRVTNNTLPIGMSGRCGQRVVRPEDRLRQPMAMPAR